MVRDACLDIMNQRIHTGDKSIPVHRVAILRPFSLFLRDIGAPVERRFQQAGLPYFALDNVDNYVPSHRFYSFLINTAQREGIEDLGFHVSHKYGADSADPHMVHLLRHSTTLYSGLSKASTLINRTITNFRMGLLRSKLDDFSCFYYRPSCDADNPAIDQIGWFGIMILIGMVREFTGPHWQPTEIGVMGNRLPTQFIREQFPNTRIRLVQHYSYIALENTLLGLPPSHTAHALPASPLSQFEPFAKDFVGSLEQILHSYLQENDLSIEHFASACNMSKRTLQRKLTDTGTSYSTLLDHALFHFASRMLKDSDMTVTNIAHQLGYNDMSHFTRAFRRIAGVTPRAYRQQHNLDQEREIK